MQDAAPDPQDAGPSSAYNGAPYARAVAHLGRPRHLASAGTHLFVADVGDGLADACGPYPVLSCERWHALGADIASQRDLVSVVVVADALGDWTGGLLRAAFPDLARPWRVHHVLHLAAPVHTQADVEHLRIARHARRTADVQREEPSPAALDAWTHLYDGIHAGPAAAGLLPPDSWPSLFAHPGLRVFTARRGGRVLGMALWLTDGERAWFHLGASSAEGYAVGAPYAVCQAALESLRDEGVAVADLGGVAGPEDDGDDDASRFRRGWANDHRHTWLCGRILDAVAYRALTVRHGCPPDRWFPAYRTPAALLPA